MCSSALFRWTRSCANCGLCVCLCLSVSVSVHLTLVYACCCYRRRRRRRSRSCGQVCQYPPQGAGDRSHGHRSSAVFAKLRYSLPLGRARNACRLAYRLQGPGVCQELEGVQAEGVLGAEGAEDVGGRCRHMCMNFIQWHMCMGLIQSNVTALWPGMMHTHARTHTHIQIHTHTHTHTHTNTHTTHTHTYTHTHTHTRVCVFVWHVISM